MANRARDIYDVLQHLTYLSTPDVEAQNEVLDAFQAPAPDTAVLSDAVSIPNQGHAGTYYYDDATSLYGRAQYG